LTVERLLYKDESSETSPTPVMGHAGPLIREARSMRQSEAALALIRRPAPGGTEYLVQWNEKWRALNLVGGHRRPQESFRDCLLREVAEELDLRSGADYVAPDAPIAHLEYVAFSESSQQETGYTIELFVVELPPLAAERVSREPANAWVDEAALQSAAQRRSSGQQHRPAVAGKGWLARRSEAAGCGQRDVAYFLESTGLTFLFVNRRMA
jgi:8-oxo-dGTP pyrophosphatase MutT (NUDIX family)